MTDAKHRPNRSTANTPVPDAVVNRLSLYLRELQLLILEGRETINSTHLGSLLGFSDAQVRKDLAYFGQFGYPGVGYRCIELIDQIKKILGTDRQWSVTIVGIGNLGKALLSYRGFENQGFRVVAAFDTDPAKVNQVIDGITIYPLDRLADLAAQHGIQLGVIAVPASAAQSVADALAEAGVDGILNFAPVTVSVPSRVKQVAVDLAVELEQLTFAVVNRPENA